MTKHIHWDGNLSQEGFEIVKGEGGVIVCPTKVGYIIMTSDKKVSNVNLKLKAQSQQTWGCPLRQYGRIACLSPVNTRN